ncbi:permease, partial [Rhizobiaceae sp. 2RAB30]
MDFMRFLKSVEELLYELVSWLVFYPVTFWRSVTRPAKMMRYADLELGDRLEEQYKDTLSPPLFLLITLLIAHGVELALLARQDRSALPAIFASDTNLLILRAVMYGIFPLVMAVTLVRGRKIRLDRD